MNSPSSSSPEAGVNGLALDLGSKRRGSVLVLWCHGIAIVATFALLCSYFFIGNTVYFDQQTFWLGCGWLAGAAVLAVVAYRRAIHLVDLTLLWVYMFMLPRLVQYLLSPATVVLPVGDMTLDEVNHGLAAGLMLTAAFTLGIVAVYRRRLHLPRINRRPISYATLAALFVAYIGMMVLETLVYSGMGASVYSLDLFEKASIPKWLTVFLTVSSADVLLFGVMFWFVLRDHTPLMHPRTWIALAVGIVAVLAYNYGGVLAGSRSSGFRILLYAAALGLALLRHEPRALKRAAVLGLFALVTSVALVPVAHVSRDRLIQGEATVPGIGTPVETGAAVVLPPRDSDVEGVAGAAMRIINRFGYLDYLIITLAREPDAACAANYLTWSYYARNVVNFVAPGDPYEKARLNSSNAFGICYRGITPSQMPSYHSEIWTLPGIVHLMSPPYLSIVSIFAVGLVFGFATRRLQYMDGPVAAIAYPFWIYLFPFCVYFSMGVDHTINTYVTFALRLAVMLILIEAMARLTRARPAGAAA